MPVHRPPQERSTIGSGSDGRGLKAHGTLAALAIVGLFALACGGTPPAVPLSPDAQVLRFGSLVTGTGIVINDAVVVIDGDRIVSVGNGVGDIPDGIPVTDLSAYTGIPGMIDAHTHITYWRLAPGSTDPFGAGGTDGRRTEANRLAGAAENAMRTLETGVTTVRDLGASGFADLAVRDSIASGAMVGPRVFAAGHGLSKVNRPLREGETSGAATGRIREIAEIPVAVLAQVDGGADYIKMYGSTGSFANVTQQQTFTFEEMKAAVDEAREQGKEIAIHSYGPEGARDAMRAGATTVEHATDVTDQVLAEWAQTNTILVPTIDHNRFYAENAEALGYSDEQVADLRDFISRNLETARKAHAAGIRFAMGSDAVYWMHGENTAELGWFVEAGMTPAEALQTATVNGAEILGASDDLGLVAPGFFADIVAVEGNPLQDINAVIEGVRWVMKGGEVVVDMRTPQEMGSTLDMTTWSIAAMDPATGDVGVSMASCVPDTYGDAVAALVPGVGVAATQAGWALVNRDSVFADLRAGKDAQTIISEVTAPTADESVANRQYGVITLQDGQIEMAGYTGAGNSDWAGVKSAWDAQAPSSLAVTAQGNTLVSEAVVGDALAAFQRTDPNGMNTLADRLMRALEAGSAAGGDVRCNRNGLTSTAATAMIVMARGGDPPYATADIGITDAGTEAAPYLALSYHVPRDGPNPIPELRRQYDEWRRTNGR